MTTAKIWSFTTASSDITPPAVVRTVPSNGATGVTADASKITVTFNEGLRPPSTATFSVKASGSSTSIAGTYWLRSDGITIVFQPSSSLQSGTTYTASLSGVRDLAGNIMTTAKIWSFTTASQDSQLFF